MINYKMNANMKIRGCFLMLFLFATNGNADQADLIQRLNAAKSRLASLQGMEEKLAESHELKTSLSRLLEEEAALTNELARKSETLDEIRSNKLRAIKETREKAIGESLGDLKLESGRIYEDVKIREVTDVGMSVSHASGSARIAAKDLPEALRERFMFDSEAAAELLRAEREIALLHHLQASPVKESPPENTHTNDSGAIVNDPPAQPASTPKGNVTARIVGYRNNYKEVEFACIANCDASLTVRGAALYPPTYEVTFTLAKGVAAKHTVLVRNKYSAVLQNSEGRMLDQESSLRKTGLGGTSLNN
jgi:regulator of replication initiation timing